MKPRNDPVKLTSQFFPSGWDFMPLAPYKSLVYYKDILVETESIFIKPIYANNDKAKVLYHSLYIKQFIQMSEWGKHPSDLMQLSNQDNSFCYYDYIEAWYKVFLHQNESHRHSWLVQFDHKFKSHFPYWFSHWWARFGSTYDLLPDPLKVQLNHFCNHKKLDSAYEGVPVLLQFVSKYKIPWILRWEYSIQNSTSEISHNASPTSPSAYPFPLVTRQWFVKWWDKFDVNRIVGQVQLEFPTSLKVLPVSTAEPSSQKSKESSVSKKSKESRVSPTGSTCSRSIYDFKDCSGKELKLIAQALNKRIDELHEDASTGSSSASCSQ
ncbi:MAG TPA: hypothetical protein VF487_12265, partial [Chitinophagaceae bacterium]